jgi:hypothetical protein
MAGTPHHAGISGKKKGPEIIRALQFGGVDRAPNNTALQPDLAKQRHGERS